MFNTSYRLRAGAIFLLLLLLSSITAPAALAATPREFLNIWQGASCVTNPAEGEGPTDPCTLCDALVVGSNIIYNLFVAALFVSVAMVVAGGVMFMMGGASPNMLSQGKSMMLSAVSGLAIALAAWLIINTLFSFLAGGRLTAPWNSFSCQESSIQAPAFPTSAPENNSPDNSNNQSNNPYPQIERMIAQGCQSQIPVCAAQNVNQQSSDQGNTPKIPVEAYYSIACVKNSAGDYDAQFTVDCIAAASDPWLKCSDGVPDLSKICK